MRSGSVSLVLSRLLVMVLAVLCCLGAAAPSSVAQDGMKDVTPSEETEEGAGSKGTIAG